MLGPVHKQVLAKLQVGDKRHARLSLAIFSLANNKRLFSTAFLLPIMERILQRGGGRVQLKASNGRNKASSVTATRGLIMTPTRELAAQCLGMMTAMAKFTGLRALLIVGGAKNVNAQVSWTNRKGDVNNTATNLPWRFDPNTMVSVLRRWISQERLAELL